ncbi:hypothetical protein FH972_024973 [Carpinus fangiana]|uniref:Uncharacterized protein n=1 Tax=Carpinus fangiana TaxID=176857 RepID=A0A5N6L086_9ROSI|nr:hypothetical protein FH972_024973 [Carpinus fangiana]
MATDEERIQKLEVDMLEVKESIQKLTQTTDAIKHILKELSEHFAIFLGEFSTHFAKCHDESSCHLEKETKELSCSSRQSLV